MDGDDGKIEIREGGDGPDKVGVVHALPVVTLVLAERIPEGIDGTALEPDQQELGDIDDDV